MFTDDAPDWCVLAYEEALDRPTVHQIAPAVLDRWKIMDKHYEKECVVLESFYRTALLFKHLRHMKLKLLACLHLSL